MSLMVLRSVRGPLLLSSGKQRVPLIGDARCNKEFEGMRIKQLVPPPTAALLGTGTNALSQYRKLRSKNTEVESAYLE